MKPSNVVQAINKALKKELGVSCLITEYNLEVHGDGLGTATSWIVFFTNEEISINKTEGVRSWREGAKMCSEYKFKYVMNLYKGSAVRKRILKAMLAFN